MLSDHEWQYQGLSVGANEDVKSGGEERGQRGRGCVRGVLLGKRVLT